VAKSLGLCLNAYINQADRSCGATRLTTGRSLQDLRLQYESKPWSWACPQKEIGRRLRLNDRAYTKDSNDEM
jgi:hypothetical protein